MDTAIGQLAYDLLKRYAKSDGLRTFDSLIAATYTPAFIGFGILPLVCAAILWVFLGPLRPRGRGLPRPYKGAV